MTVDGGSSVNTKTKLTADPLGTMKSTFSNSLTPQAVGSKNVTVQFGVVAQITCFTLRAYGNPNSRLPSKSAYHISQTLS